MAYYIMRAGAVSSTHRTWDSAHAAAAKKVGGSSQPTIEEIDRDGSRVYDLDGKVLSRDEPTQWEGKPSV